MTFLDTGVLVGALLEKHRLPHVLTAEVARDAQHCWPLGTMTQKTLRAHEGIQEGRQDDRLLLVPWALAIPASQIPSQQFIAAGAARHLDLYSGETEFAQ